jgi:hypothetical protein
MRVPIAVQSFTHQSECGRVLVVCLINSWGYPTILPLCPPILGENKIQIQSPPELGDLGGLIAAPSFRWCGGLVL